MDMPAELFIIHKSKRTTTGGIQLDMCNNVEIQDYAKWLCVQANLPTITAN